MTEILTTLREALPTMAAALAPVVVLLVKKAAATASARIPDWLKVSANLLIGVVIATLAEQVAGTTLTGGATTDGLLGAALANKVRDLNRWRYVA